MALPHPAGDQLRVLRAEVDDEDGVELRLAHKHSGAVREKVSPWYRPLPARLPDPDLPGVGLRATYQDRKIAGILSEGVYRHDVYHVVVGIGENTNVDLEKLPAEVQPKATTLKREVNLFVANEEFLDYLLNQVDDLYSRYRNTRIEFLVKDYRGQCTTIGKRVSVTMGKEKLTGKAYDIGTNGALVIIDDQGAKHDFFEGTLEILK